jgi:hypothetical protein
MLVFQIGPIEVRLTQQGRQVMAAAKPQAPTSWRQATSIRAPSAGLKARRGLGATITLLRSALLKARKPPL